MLRARATVQSLVKLSTAATLAAFGAAAFGAAPASAAGCPKPGGAAVAAAPAPRAEVVVSGHGWGHGMGMSQYGAQGAARLGCGYRTILGTYYRATRLDTWGMAAPVRLSLLTAAGTATVTAENGTVRWPGATQPKGSTWTVLRRGAGVAVRDARGERAWVKDGSALTASHTGTVIRVRAYRPGATSPSADLRTRYDQARFTGRAGTIGVVQQLVTSGGHTAVQKYLWGLAEVPSSWPAEALKAQAVAARTYLTSKARNGGYELTTTTADQVYRGWAKESTDTRSAWHDAVEATAGQVLVDRASARPITAMYSSSMGGFTEDRQYVYGTYGISYLRAVDDSRWDLASDNPYRSWVVGYSKAQLARRFGLATVTGLTVAARGDAARVGGVTVTGTSGGKRAVQHFTGAQFRAKLGLRSPGFTISVGQVAPVTPPAPVTPITPAPVARGPQPLAGDWDGDGTTDPGWYDSGAVSLRVDGKPLRFRFGGAGDVAVVGDWDGDGKDGLAVFRAGRWFIREAHSTGVAERVVSLGRAGDLPVAGRWNSGTAADGIGVVRNGAWYLRYTASSGIAERALPFGASAAGVPLVGDWDGDGRDEPGARVANVFHLAGPVSAADGWVDAPAELTATSFGRAVDRPLAGDWDGNGTDTPAVVQDASFAYRNDLESGRATAAITFAR